MNTSDINNLLEKYLNGTSTEQENAALETWYMRYENKSLADVADQVRIEQLDRIRKQVAQYSAPARTYKLWPTIAVAAAAVAAITLGVWLYYTPRHPDAGQDPGSAQYATDIAPGKNGATITLANGKVIQLSDAKSGVVIGKNDLKYSDSTLVIGSLSSRANAKDLDPSEVGMTSKVQNLTASTAKGQTYQFTLPDGTKVWLNADSKLEFPSNFVNSKTRFVKLSGEGYFEVEKDKAHPFIVATDKQEVEVLGTHFNVTAYSDEESTKTTLLEGSVAVTSYTPRSKRPGERADVFPGTVLAPNQQSILTGSNRLNIKEVDASLAVAWKEGSFRFKSETISEIMRKVQRWYDVEVVYTDQSLGDIKFSGTISRYENVSRLLDILQTTERLQFKIEGRKVYVSK
jgi:ferric-dicitrate binding protein FerR (iron transport regulator)